MIVPCECGAKLKIDDAKVADREVRVRCPRCGNILTVPKQAAAPAPAARDTAAVPASPASSGRFAPLVLIAHESDVVRDMVGGVLLDHGFRVEHAADGVDTLSKTEELAPQAMIVDVGLPGIYGFEICERLKSDPRTSGIKIILLASVYGITRYKRQPTSLYGADDYIEKHHIADSLVPKINRLLESNGGDAARPPAPPAEEADLPLFRPESLVQEDQNAVMLTRETPAPEAGEAVRGPLPAGADEGGERVPEGHTLVPESFSLDSSIFEKEECDIPRVEETDPEAVEKAKRFARIIVSDIALYNQEAVSEGVRKGTFYELLKDDVEEGRRLYEARVPAAIRAYRDYYKETLDTFLAAQKRIAR